MTLDEVKRDLVDHLQGTCMNSVELFIDDLIEQETITEEFWQDNEVEVLAYVDSCVFNCNQCGWWYDISDMADNDEWICAQCEDQ
jgi:hypothetical protein